MISFRHGIPADFEALVAIDTVAGSNPARQQAIRDWLAAGATAVAESDGKLVAYGVMRPIFFHEPFVVDAATRQTGIARALLAHLDGCHDRPKLWTSTNRSNAPMQALLVSEGFIYAGEVEGLDEGDPEMFYYRSRAS